MQLQVIYDSKDDKNEKLDLSIEQALEPLGFKRWGSGYDPIQGKRNLRFDNQESGGQVR